MFTKTNEVEENNLTSSGVPKHYAWGDRRKQQTKTSIFVLKTNKVGETGVGCPAINFAFFQAQAEIFFSRKKVKLPILDDILGSLKCNDFLET